MKRATDIIAKKKKEENHNDEKKNHQNRVENNMQKSSSDYQLEFLRSHCFPALDCLKPVSKIRISREISRARSQQIPSCACQVFFFVDRSARLASREEKV